MADMVTRFAPSPTGPLHLGHAYAAIFAHDLAKRNGGRFLLRIEDIDRSRSRDHWEEAIHEDLAWLGINSPYPVMRQSEQSGRYHAALQSLWSRGALFACECNRADIRRAIAAPQEGDAWPIGPDGPVYPGICTNRKLGNGADLPIGFALRLSMKTVREVSENEHIISFQEAGSGPSGQRGEITATFEEFKSTVGELVLGRRDFGTSYHLSVVLDDAAQGVTDVSRGEDLFEATKIHVVLQRLLGLPTPTYHHHPLVRDEAGKRLAKRDDARAISEYRRQGRMIGLADCG